MPETEPQFLDVGAGANKRRIAYRAEPGRGGAGVVWLSGFKSDMAGTKAAALAAWAREKGLGCVRFDYSGHGLSDGRFEDGTIGRWLEEAAGVFENVATPMEQQSRTARPPSPRLRGEGGGEGRPLAPRLEPAPHPNPLPVEQKGATGRGNPTAIALATPNPSPQGGGESGHGGLVLVGSSMGGYIALLLLRRLLREAPEQAGLIAGLILIAPAWDMTEELIWERLSGADRERLVRDGAVYLPSDYGDPIPVTRRLIEDGRAHLLSREPFDPGRPVRVLQGLRDPDVPPDHARRLADLLPGGRVEFVEIPDGDHSLSRPQDLAALFVAVEGAFGAR